MVDRAFRNACVIKNVEILCTNNAYRCSELSLERADSAVWNDPSALIHLKSLKLLNQTYTVVKRILVIASKQGAFSSADNCLRGDVKEIPRVAAGANTRSSACNTAKRTTQTTVRKDIVIHFYRASC